ncbi:MAG: TonB family protein [Colwellia sp.]
MNKNRIGISTIFALILVFSTNIYAEQSLNSQFKVAYHAYQDAIKNNNSVKQLKYAIEAYILGEKLYGTDNINTANLGLLLAKLCINIEKLEQANTLLLDALEVFKVEYGKNASELAEIYILLGQAQPHKKIEQAIDYLLTAIDIAEDHQEEFPYFTAKIQLESGIWLLHHGSYQSKIILTAQAFFKKHLSANDNGMVKANFYVGKYYLAQKNYRKAIKNWQLNLPVFKHLQGASHPLALNTHAFLIHALEKTGNSEEATKHCIAIGSMTPWDDSQEPTSLFKVSPAYPLNDARKGKEGWVQMSFIISDIGTVKEPKIIDSEGGEGFERSAIAALKKWRFAPKFDHGKAVEFNSSLQMDFKMGF